MNLTSLNAFTPAPSNLLPPDAPKPLLATDAVPDPNMVPLSPDQPLPEPGHDENQVKAALPPEQQLTQLLAQGQPANAAALRAALPAWEGLLDGEVSPADVQGFSGLLGDLRAKLGPEELATVLASVSQALVSGKGQVPELIQLMQAAAPTPALNQSLALAELEQGLQRSEAFAAELLGKAGELMRTEIAPATASPAGCAAAYGKLAGQQQDCLSRIAAELDRIGQALAQPGAPQARLESLQAQLKAAHELLSGCQRIAHCLSKQAGQHPDYPVDIPIPGYAAVNDLSSRQLQQLADLGESLKATIAAHRDAAPELLKASAWSVDLAETVSGSLSDGAFREATRSLKLDTHPAAVALQYATQQKLVANGEAQLAGKPWPNPGLGWYHPRCGTGSEAFMQVRLNGPKQLEALRGYVDTQLDALSMLSADELRQGKGDALRTEIAANLKARLISDRSIASFMAEVDTRLGAIEAAQPELGLDEVRVSGGTPVSRKEIDAFNRIYKGLIEAQLKNSKDPAVQKYAKALELMQTKPGEGDALRYQENALAEAKQLLDQSLASPVLQKLFEDARVQARELMFVPGLLTQRKSVSLSAFELMPSPERSAQAQARIEQLMRFIEGAAEQGADPSEQMAMLQALAPDQVRVLSQRIASRDALEAFAGKALADPAHRPAIAARTRELLVRAFVETQGGDAAKFKADISLISDAEMITLAKTLKENVSKLETVLKTFKVFSGDEKDHHLESAKELVKLANREHLGGSIALAGALLGVAGEGFPEGWGKWMEDGAAFTTAVAETFLSKDMIDNAKVKLVLAGAGMVEHIGKLTQLFSKESWDFKDYLALSGGVAGLGKAGFEVVGEAQRWKHTIKDLENTAVMGKYGGFYKCLGKVAAVVGVVLDGKAVYDASQRKDHVGLVTSVVQVGAGATGFVAVCAGSGPVGWAALAVYGVAVGVDAIFGMSAEAEQVMDLRNAAGLTQAMTERYNAIATREVITSGGRNGMTTTRREELPHAEILAKVQAKPAAERNSDRAAVIHSKLEEALTSDYDEDLIKALIDQAHGEGPAVFNDLIDKLGGRMLGYVSERNGYLIDILDKMIASGCSVEAGSKFHNLLVGLAENHNNEVVIQVLDQLSRKHPALAAKVPAETLISICDRLMKGQTDGAEEKAIHHLLAAFATDAQFQAVMGSDEVSRFFKDMASELSYGQTASLLVRAAELDASQQSTRTVRHLYLMADFGLGQHSETLRDAVETRLAASSRANDPQIREFSAWIHARKDSNWQALGQELSDAITGVPMRARRDEADELRDYKRFQNIAKLEANKPAAVAGVRHDRAVTALRALSRLESAQLQAEPRRAEALMLALLQYRDDAARQDDPELLGRIEHQCERLALIMPKLDLKALAARAASANQTESANYDRFVASVTGFTISDLNARLMADPTLSAMLQRAW